MGPKLRRALLDLAIVVVIFGHVAAFFVLRADQRRFDDEAGEVAAWMDEHGLERVAWPVEDREAVPALLDAGVTPVLVDPGVAPQDLAVNDTGAFVAADSPPDGLLATLSDAQELGSVIVWRVDLERAASTPLAIGESVGEQIARPYVYSPLRDSAVIRPEEPFRVELWLAPGRYELSAQLFDPTTSSSARLTAATRAAVLARETIRPQVIVRERSTLSFVVDGDRPRSVTVRIDAVPARRGGDEVGTVLMHAWRVECPEPTR